MSRAHRVPRPVLALVAALAGVLGLSACNNQPIVGGASVTTAASNISGPVEVGTVNGFGRVLVTASGHALYLSSADPRDGSACYEACTLVWPPLVVAGSTVKAGAGVDAHLLSTFRDHAGEAQVLYGGHALYTYTADAGVGMTTGEGLTSYGATWWLVSPSGRAVTRASLT